MGQSTWEQLCSYQCETALLSSTLAVLGWDERTGMPSAAGSYRAEQLTYLSGMIHQRQTAQQLDDWLTELAESDLADDPHSDSGTTIRQLRREYDRRTRLPQSLVEELTRAAVLGQQAWVSARSNDSFAEFKPHLEKLLSLKQQEADAIGHDGCRYDALLDEYEPGAKTAEVATVLNQLCVALVPLIHQIKESSQKAPAELLRRNYPIEAQRKLGVEAATAVGFDFQRGRLDETEHPFCTSLGPNDCRILTRYDASFFASAFFGTLHEAGHGIYDQGLRTELHGLPPGEYVSLGIHESQSRLWENFVGRSLAFWKYFFPRAQEMFPQALTDVSVEQFYAAVNDVQPSLIRVEADEATYNLHIIIRFELEQALVDGTLAVDDLPDAWNEKYSDYLGITPPSNADGVLQDIHWSGGAIGYFSTYSLGNLYAAQFFRQARLDLGDLDAMFAAGEFSPLRQWLQTKIHQVGQCYSAAGILEQVTGEPLQHQTLVDHLYAKYGPLYGVTP